MMTKFRYLTISLIALTAVFSLSACDDKPVKIDDKITGVVQNVGDVIEGAGKKVNQVVIDTSKAAQNAADSTGEKMTKIVKDAEIAADKAGKEMTQAITDAGN